MKYISIHLVEQSLTISTIKHTLAMSLKKMKIQT